MNFRKEKKLDWIPPLLEDVAVFLVKNDELEHSQALRELAQSILEKGKKNDYPTKLHHAFDEPG